MPLSEGSSKSPHMSNVISSRLPSSYSISSFRSSTDSYPLQYVSCEFRSTLSKTLRNSSACSRFLSVTTTLPISIPIGLSPISVVPISKVNYLSILPSLSYSFFISFHFLLIYLLLLYITPPKTIKNHSVNVTNTLYSLQEKRPPDVPFLRHVGRAICYPSNLMPMRSISLYTIEYGSKINFSLF